MFPLDFPVRVLSGRAEPGQWVLDPFSGRGTTNYAARLLGLPSIGIDSSPVAAALTEAKLANATPEEIVETATRIIGSAPPPNDLPHGQFWKLAFHPRVLETLCKLREALRTIWNDPEIDGIRSEDLAGDYRWPRTPWPRRAE